VAHFSYQAFDASGRPLTGRIEAESREAALRALAAQGHLPVDAVESAEGADTPSGGGWLDFGRRLPTPANITLFTQELGLLLASGQPLAQALQLIEGDVDSPRVQALAQRLRASIAAGKSLSEAMALEGTLFPPFYIGMVKAGEATGELASVLTRVAESREREEKLRQRFTSAMLYPSLLILMAIASILLMMTVVVPQFKGLLGDQVARLPPASQAVLATSDWVTANGEALAIGFGVLVLSLALLSRQPAVRSLFARMLYAMPLIGPLMRLSLTAAFCRALGVLLSSGLGLPAALALTRNVIGNDRARDMIDGIGVALREGRDFSEPLRQSSIFPPLVTSMLRIGSESGSLANSALRLADMYETKLEIGMQRLVTVLEPTIILLLSIIIGFIVLTVMSAVVGVYDLTG
jgi:type II secretory pathway component PulF